MLTYAKDDAHTLASPEQPVPPLRGWYEQPTAQDHGPQAHGQQEPTAAEPSATFGHCCS